MAARCRFTTLNLPSSLRARRSAAPAPRAKRNDDSKNRGRASPVKPRAARAMGSGQSNLWKATSGKPPLALHAEKPALCSRTALNN